MNTLNLKQAAAFLKMHPVTLLQKANAGIVPAAKPAKCWVFIQQDLLDYLRGLYLIKNHNHVAVTKNNQPNISNNVTVTNNGLGVEKAYFQLLKITDCPQIHSPKPDSRSGARHADEVNQVAKGEAVGLVVNSVNMTQSKARMM
ncbi:MAG: helix-turn-helix domain-containing protein [Methylotenera sp.]|uniref:helix-turn-helix domain-containing protein n=1 Tax=Methylotenera sp. TaxID=2051956 RepID=UPI002717F659|nr:helix-turn-helix domain-containing protein [Methylotenera sp.]MDO9393472.1 helix-turn-helix domain-containing protein [Methylotenera sp.]MDP1523007.1 helix-turn-helix domain-containing protein [Methylotenera sp.]MDP1765553.1 helix-turn-helix domain-containing protein [Methylotenera sp.]MDP3308604.1 helix-turn-helix domain-containing protein [Methylotenera sp.]MDP3819816.1 helix-turn-helix domain-containing protein [Methylotenera sp.]